MITFYKELLTRFHELHQDIKNTLEPLPENAMDWSPGTEMNSLSVLVVHLSGAERFLVGDVVLGESSNRSRDAEFQARGMTKADLVACLDATEAYLASAFDRLTLADLEASRVHPRHGGEVSVAFALLHALEHAATHTGHITITAQLWHQRG